MSETPEITIEVARLAKSYGSVAAVNDISFSVKRGEIVGLLGPNGAGKTTTLKMLSGLLFPTAGDCQTRSRSAAADSGCFVCSKGADRARHQRARRARDLRAPRQVCRPANHRKPIARCSLLQHWQHAIVPSYDPAIDDCRSVSVFPASIN